MKIKFAVDKSFSHSTRHRTGKKAARAVAWLKKVAHRKQRRALKKSDSGVGYGATGRDVI